MTAKGTESELERLRLQLAALTSELGEVSAQLEESLAHIETIEEARTRAERDVGALREASVRSALLMEQLEAREQFFREEAESWSQTSHSLTSELESAGAIQRLLLPRHPPQGLDGLELALAFYPAAQTSGDWFGFVDESASRRFHIFIGDAMGHGLAASLITAGAFAAVQSVHAVERILAPHLAAIEGLAPLTEPAQLLRVLDAVVAAMGGSHAMTFFASTFDAVSRTLRYANAGHCHPILVRHGGDVERAVSLRGSGRQLGGEGATLDVWKEEWVSLRTGDLLLLYSDGLVEALDKRKRTVGPRRLADWMTQLRERSIDEIRDGLWAHFNDFVGTRTGQDDVTFIVARVRD